MKYISTTDLRTQSSELVQTLLSGNKVSLIHRSKIVGVIQPPTEKDKKFNAKTFYKLVDKAKDSKHLTETEQQDIYRKHLTDKYGKYLS